MQQHIMEGDTLVVFVNGIKHEVTKPSAETTLLQYLRTELCLPGTKLACGEGGCGACTVMVSCYNPTNKNIRHYTVNACLMPLVALHGLAVTTVEGIGSTKTKLHPVQERLAKAYGSQCGFCSPGFVMSMYTLLRNYPEPSMSRIETAFQGNLCRCTGYRSILAGFRTFSKEWACEKGENCCQNQKQGEQNSKICTKTFDASEFAVYDQTQDPIFPSELQIKTNYHTKTITFTGPTVQWCRPTSLNELCQLKQDNPDAVFTVGATSVGKDIRTERIQGLVLCLSHVPELLDISSNDIQIKVGAAVTLAQLYEYIETIATDTNGEKKLGLQTVLDMLHQVGGHQLRNVVSIGSNIASGGGRSDVLTLLMAMGATADIINAQDKSTECKAISQLVADDGSCLLLKQQIITSVNIPYLTQGEHLYWHKHAPRTDLNLATVNCGMKVKLNAESNTIDDLVLCYGGVGPSSQLASNVKQETRGKNWNNDVVTFVCDLLESDIDVTLNADGSVNYKKALVSSLFIKFYLKVNAIIQSQPDQSPDMSSVRSHPLSEASEVFEDVPADQAAIDTVGRPVVHKGALQQTTGEAVYCDDLPAYKNELHIVLITSKRVHAKILKIDASKAESMPGVKGFLSFADIPNQQSGHAEHIFSNEEVKYGGHVVGAIVAETEMQARVAVKHVIVEYENLPAVLTIEDAIKMNSMLPNCSVIKHGDVDAAFANADAIIEGELEMAGQEHLYMEPQSCRVVPTGEAQELEIIASTQGLADLQDGASDLLGIPQNRISVKTKRVGGGFGGKEATPLCLATIASIVALRFNKPTRLVLDRATDMEFTSKRHPINAKYKIGCLKSGKIVAEEVHFYINAGYTPGMYGLLAIASLLNLAADSGYKIDNFKLSANVCLTNINPSGAMRGFMSPPLALLMQTIMNDVTVKLNLPSTQVHEINMYKTGDRTFYNRELNDAGSLKVCWDTCLTNGDYYKRKAEVDKFNSASKWTKRGLSAIPVYRELGIPVRPFAQGAALVNIYKDGSVWISHGGVEMGQGLHTKIIQVASRVLEIPCEAIHVLGTDTNCVPNALMTAASHGTDLFGMAVKDACETLVKRLEPYKRNSPDKPWAMWVMHAYLNCTSLSATGFYDRGPEYVLNFQNPYDGGKGQKYFVCGATMAEVEVDCLTGANRVIRVDATMDLGRSLNPAIDIGQIDGAFVMAFGMLVSETLEYDENGFLKSKDINSYHIPGVRDIPTKFNTQLINSDSKEAVLFGSKGVGEPPIHMGIAAFMAIKDAIHASRIDNGVQGNFQMNSPANAQQIFKLLSVKDSIAYDKLKSNI
ncbi:unnamed protein product [Owenia fusiformis]|uniref:Xanthine dehydrogenase n=1 Tax=Owenia fusiformis TaxID=6347 RepID=A0A8S4NNG2_OWEFU|nr:unnamed protein product [Owenia fusiformis]